MSSPSPKKLPEAQLKQIIWDISEAFLNAGIEKVSQIIEDNPALKGAEARLLADAATRAYCAAISGLAFISADDNATKKSIHKTHRQALASVLQQYGVKAKDRDTHLKTRIVKP